MGKGLEYRETWGLLAGPRLGKGLAREVYECRVDPSLVVKKEMKSGSFQNVMEWEIWDTAQYCDDIKDWFAPCTHLSACGTLLIQRRTKPVRLEDLPKKIPALFTDLKVENWGWLDGRIVCHDYGTVGVKFINGSHRLVRAEWWSDNSFNGKAYETGKP